MSSSELLEVYKGCDVHLKTDNERRSELRYSVRNLAQIKIPFDKRKVSCLVLDLSIKGAVVEVSTGHIPDSFIMFNHKIRHIVACRVVWRNYPRIGLEFVTSPRYALKYFE